MGRMPVPDRLSFTAGRMPSLRAMGGYPAFPPAISLSGVGCIRVTHPCATLAPRRTLTVRLACIRPAASVHPEPGSNSSLYYCCTKCLSESRVPLCSLLTRRTGASRPAACCLLLFSLLASDFQRTQNLSRTSPSPFRFAGAKVQHSHKPTSTFFNYFASCNANH